MNPSLEWFLFSFTWWKRAGLPGTVALVASEIVFFVLAILLAELAYVGGYSWYCHVKRGSWRNW